MGIEDIRTAFVLAGEGKLQLDRATLSYADGKQVLSLSGWYAGGQDVYPEGQPFSLVSLPFDGEPSLWARQAARDLLVPTPASDNMTRSFSLMAELQPAPLKDNNSMPQMKNVQALPAALSRIFAALDKRAGATIAGAASLGDRANSSLTKVDAILKSGHAAFDQVDQMFSELDAATNGGETVEADPTPSSAPSGGSSTSQAS
jgi:hypothetical protein